MKDWWCANCSSLTDLNRHGRCVRCDSEATDIAVRPPVTVEGLASAYDWVLMEMEEVR